MPERDVEAERAGRDRLDLHRLLFAQAHDRALAEIALDLAERRFEGLLLVHALVFHQLQRSAAMFISTSAMLAMGGQTTR